MSPYISKNALGSKLKMTIFYYHFNRIDLIFICEVFSLQITDQDIVIELGLFGADYLSHQSSTFAQI